MEPNASHKKALEDDLKAYKKLERINDSQEFNDFFALQIDTVTKKILTCFTGEGPADWKAFCKLRGEVIGMLYPIQQIRGSKVLQEQIRAQLNAYYNEQPH